MVAAWGVATWGATASAQTLLVASPAGSAEPREIRVAIASGPSQVTTWFSVQWEGAADTLSLIVPVVAGDRVDSSTDAWFEALEDCTYTRIRPPGHFPKTYCENAVIPESSAVDRIGDAAHVPTVSPMGAPTWMTMADVVAFAEQMSVELSTPALTALADWDGKGYRFLRFTYEVEPGRATLRTLRIASTSSRASVPLLLSSAGAIPVWLRVWLISDRRANPVEHSWSTLDSDEVTWSLSGKNPPTNYRNLLDKALDGTSWVVDHVSHEAIYQRVGSGSAAPIPSLIETYFDRASGYGDTVSDVSACVERLSSMQSNEWMVGRVCAAGALANVQGASCTEDTQPDQIAADDLRCGGIADDLALALAEKRPKDVWLTRWTGKLASWSERMSDAFVGVEGPSQSSWMVSGQWDDDVCQKGGAGGSGAGSSSSPTGGYGGGSNWSPSPYPDENVYETGDTDESSVLVEGSCWGSSVYRYDDGDESSFGDSSNDEDGACSKGSSDSEEDQTCSGDSSDGGSDDSCSGDTSDSESVETCSGDSSDSSSSDACSGDSSADTCSGSSKNSDCSMSPHKGRGGTGKRLPTSLFGVLLAASALSSRRLRKHEEIRHPLRW